MPPSARKKSQRGIRRSEAPCSESNNQRKAAGNQSMSVSNYTDREGAQKRCRRLRPRCSRRDGRIHPFSRAQLDGSRPRISRRAKKLLLIRCHSVCLSALRVLLSSKSAIRAREQTQRLAVARILLSERFEIGQCPGKIGLQNLRFRQSQAAVAVVRIHQQGGLELVFRVFRVFELQVNAAQ